METKSEIKTCPYCGKELPQEAIFCYYCRRELLTRPERPAADKEPAYLPWWLWALAVIVLGLLVAFLAR
jgi:predicted nucleic acid-binding Zn ribbon protein